MTDITTIWNPDTGHGDWQQAAGDLVAGDDLQTAIYISLFTERQARADDTYDGDDRKGWWGDTGSGYAIGSRIWLLKRQILSPAVANAAAGYAKEALAWLIDDGIVESIAVATQIVYPRRLNMTITYQKPDRSSASVKYFWVWES